MVQVPLDKIRPNPYQPETRLNVEEETAKRFGLSILEHGLIQTPVVRRKTEGTEIYYEIGDGWLRYSGFLWLQKEGHKEYTHLPVEERELTNQQMADMILEANTVRKDLDPIEEALLFQRYIEDFKVSVTKLAKDHNITQGAVSNTIRLLQLPEDIQQKVRGREISSTHARQLLRLTSFPDELGNMVERVTKNNYSVSELDNQISVKLWQGSKGLNKDDGYGSPVFDQAECMECEFRLKIHYPYGNEKNEFRCTKEECWEKKQEAAVKEVAKTAKQEAKDSGQKILSGKDIGYDSYTRMYDYMHELDNPGECKDCEHLALFKHDLAREGKPDKVCLDKACYRRKKTKKTKDSNKIKKEQDVRLTETLGDAFLRASDYPTECLRVITRRLIPQMNAEGKMNFLKTFEVPKLSNGRMDEVKTAKMIDGLEIEVLLQMAVAATIISQRRHDSYDYSVRLSPALKRDVAMVTNTMRDHVEEVKKWRQANCKGCFYCEKELLEKSEECCRNDAWSRRIGDNGKCQGRQQIKEEEEEKQEEAVPLAQVFTEEKK